MIRILPILLFVAFATAVTTQAQVSANKIPWKKVQFCGMMFSVPEDLRYKKARGIDSCVAVLEGDKMSLSIDYGLYSGVSRYDHYLDFKETDILIDGKKGTFATYRDSTMGPKQSWVARIFVVVEPPKSDGWWGETAVNMFVVVSDRNDLAIAQKIFRSIRFKKT